MRAYYLLIPLSCALVTTDNQANTVIFKSTDPAGRVSYSDKAPEDTLDYELIEITPAIESDDDELDKRLDRMAATTKRLQEDRKQRELAGKPAQQEKDTVVYYPAANPSHSHYSRRNNHRYSKRTGYLYQYPDSQHDSYSSSHRRRSHSSSLNLGFGGSRFNGSLQLRNRQSVQRRQLPYSPLLKHRQRYN